MIESDLPPVMLMEGGFAVVIEPDVAPAVVALSEPGPRGAGAADVSSDPDNRLTVGSDGGLFVRDTFIPDPLAYYILAKE